MTKTVFETIPELNQIARELGIKVNDGKVLKEYFKRHPEERNKKVPKRIKTNKMEQTKLATSATKEGITKMINDYWYSKNYSVNFANGEIIGLKGIMKGFRVIEIKGRYVFISEQ
jgi:hypothetical protein